MSENTEPLDKDDIVDIDDWQADLTYREVHLFAEGAFDGIRHVDPRFSKRVQGRVVGDSWYYKGAWVMFYLLKIAIIALVGVTASGGLPA